MAQQKLFLGVDGGGTSCRARLENEAGDVLGLGFSGPATARLGVDAALLSVMVACRGALLQAGLKESDFSKIHTGIGLAGLGRKGVKECLEAWKHPFARVTFESDGFIACLGAYRGGDGAIIILGTGSVAFARLEGNFIRLGGYGFPISDEASGADLGLSALRYALRAHDGRIVATDLLEEVLARFNHNPFAIVDWMDRASATDYATIAPLVLNHAAADDPIAVRIMKNAAEHVDDMIFALHKRGVPKIAIIGGIAPFMKQWLKPEAAALLNERMGDSMSGAILLAKEYAK